jgi:hypothetical protein
LAVIGVMILALTIVKLPLLGAQVLNLLAVRHILAAPLCDPAWFMCASIASVNWYPPQHRTGNSEKLPAAGLLQMAERLAPDYEQTYRRQAEVLFALGQRQAAADLLRRHGWGIASMEYTAIEDYPRSSAAGIPASRSPLLASGRYEYYLIRGHQYLLEERPAEAANDFQLALANAGERALPADRRYLFLALAQVSAQQNTPVSRYLTGKYSVLADEPQQAINWLTPLVNAPLLLPAEDAARAAWYLGQAHEAMDDLDGAIRVYREGWRIAPDVRENAISLVSALSRSGRQDQSQEIRDQLWQSGPSRHAGRTAVGTTAFYTPTLPAGWSFIGFDADLPLVEQSAHFPAWTWWKKPAGGGKLADTRDLIDLGDVIVQREWLVNEAQNPGFEWGTQPNGVPYGWNERIYTDTLQSLFVETTDRNGETTRVAMGANLESASSGLRGKDMPVQPNGWYLLAAWQKQQNAPKSSIGRACTGAAVSSGPYFPPWPDKVAEGKWVYVVDLGPAYPQMEPTNCQLMLINFDNPGGVVMWDDLVFARVAPPDVTD